MKSALIIEDEKYSADRMTKLVENLTPLKVIDVLYSVKSAKEWLKNNQIPDIIFLDIQLGDGTGFDVLDILDGSDPCIIFTTAFDEYTLKAFKYNSIDYLLKPIKEKELKAAVQKYERVNSSHLGDKIESLRKDLVKEYRGKFLIKTGLKYQSVSTDEIGYFFSKEGTSYLRKQNEETMIVDTSLETIEQSLDPAMFFRINRHMIVNESCIDSIDSFFNSRLILDVSPSFEEDVIVSRDKVKSFKNWLDS